MSLADLEAEKTVLGAVLLSPDLLAEVSAVCKVADFQHGDYRAIFAAMLELDAKWHPIDVLSVANQAARPRFGIEQLTQLQSEIVTVSNIAYHAKRIASKSRRQKLAAAYAHLAAAAQSELDDETYFSSASAKTLELEREAGHIGGPVGIKAIMGQSVKTLETRYQNRDKPESTPIRFGIESLDAVLGGLRPGNLVVIGGRPGSGKTSLLGQAVANGAVLGVAWLLFSLEMQKDEVADRLYQGEGVNIAAARSGQMQARDWTQVTKTTSQFSSPERIWVDDAGDQGALTLGDIRARARKWRMNEGKEFARFGIAIDYFQLIRVTADPRGRSSRREGLDEISRELKALAKVLQCPVLLLAGLNREMEKTNRRPVLSDIRECGQLEADADVVMFTHRPELHSTNDEERAKLAGQAELVIGKNRHGETGIVQATFDGNRSRFSGVKKTYA